ncbi:MAG: hypothetical protein ACKVOP_05900 [Sphingomonadaceae bacterium]
MQPSRLDDPEYAPLAWARFRKLMWWNALVSLLTALAGLVFLHWQYGPLTIHMGIAAALGLFFTVLLAASLMGLVFLSSGSGHDESIDDPFSDLAP